MAQPQGPTPPQMSPQEQNPLSSALWVVPARQLGGGTRREGARLSDNRSSCAVPPPLIDPWGRLAGHWLTPTPASSATHPRPKPQRGVSSRWRGPSLCELVGDRRPGTHRLCPWPDVQGRSPALQLPPRGGWVCQRRGGTCLEWGAPGPPPHTWSPLAALSGLLAPKVRTHSEAQPWPGFGGHLPSHLSWGWQRGRADEGAKPGTEQPAQAAHRACGPHSRAVSRAPPPTHTAEKQAPARGEPAGTQSN